MDGSGVGEVGSEVGGIIFSSSSWARGAVGSASDWQSEGQGFESPRVHQIALSCVMQIRATQIGITRACATKWVAGALTLWSDGAGRANRCQPGPAVRRLGD